MHVAVKGCIAVFLRTCCHYSDDYGGDGLLFRLCNIYDCFDHKQDGVIVVKRNPNAITQAIREVRLLAQTTHNNENQYNSWHKPHANTAGAMIQSLSIATNAYSYSYDSIGNSLHSAWNEATNLYTANALNQYTAILRDSEPPCEPTYDADGNLAAWNGRNFGWNSENRLCEAVIAGSDCGFMRDGSGRCFTDWDYAEDTYTDRVFDGWNPVFERVFDASTELPLSDTVYVWGTDLSSTLQGAGGVGGLLAVKRNGVWYAPLYDANGNITAYVSETGAVVAEYEYDSFGNTIAQSGSLADSFRHRFSTKPWIAALGAYDYGERLYSPALRRWISRDPIGEDGGVNLYAMCGNDAVDRGDYLGLYTLKDARKSLRRQNVKQLGAGLWGQGEYTDAQTFDEWIRLEKSNGAWWTALPKCPAKICIRSHSPVNPDPQKWKNPNEINIVTKHYHPGARYEMRSNPSLGVYGNQCTYDAEGDILTNIPAAGTVDFYSPGVNFWGHQYHDVYTFDLAKKLNRIKDYYSVRPSWNE